MEEKLKEIVLRFDDLQAQLGDPAVYSDAERLRKVNRELKELTPVAEASSAYFQARKEASEAEALLSDPDFRELAREELERANRELRRLEEELRVLLTPRDPHDGRSVGMELRSGVGGEEGALFAAALLRMYSMYAQRRGWHTDIVSLNETELGGVKECSVLIEGDDAYSRLKFESGVHRVQRAPPWRCCRRRRTWSWRSIPRICRSTRTAPPAQAASTSTRRSPPSASPTCLRARWWSARMSAASIKTRIRP